MMGFKKYVTSSFKVTVAFIGFLLAFYTVVNFTIFLSDLNINKDKQYIYGDSVASSRSLFVDMGLLTIFILQHSFMGSLSFKNLFTSNHLGDLHRSIYIISTALALQFLMRNWQPTPNLVIWNYSTKTGLDWWIFCAVHIFSWILIYVGSICMDVNELLGIKQVYYSIKSLPDPCSQKSHQLQKLYSHMRHPGFLAFLLIFWVFPVMTMDRLLFATIVTLYMYISWKTDHGDYHYQQLQYVRKFHELDRLK